MLFVNIFRSNISYYNNSLENIAKALAIFVISWIVLAIFRKIVLIKIKNFSEKTINKVDDILASIAENIGPFSYPVFSVYLSLKFLNIPDRISQIISIIFVFIIAYESIKAFKKIFNFYVNKYLLAEKDEIDAQNTRSIMQVAQLIIVSILWIIVFLLILTNLGINVNSVVASLGIGGIAIALAVQNILSDLLSAFSIYLDKPFIVGDYILIGQDSGTVEKIGIKSTHLRTLSGEQLIVPNKELTSIRVNNFKRMEKRREEIKISVVYGTTTDKLEKIPNVAEKIIAKNKNLEFLRCHLVEMGDFSLIFSLMYYVKTGDYNLALDAKQRILLDLYNEFNKQKIDFAYPTQEVIVRK